MGRRQQWVLVPTRVPSQQMWSDLGLLGEGTKIYDRLDDDDSGCLDLEEWVVAMTKFAKACRQVLHEGM